MGTQSILIRLYVEGSAEEADSVSKRLEERLSRRGGEVRVRAPGPYWKLKGHEEVCLRLSSEQPTVDYSWVLGEMGSGWLDNAKKPGSLASFSAVWSKDMTGAFVEQSVQWAHVEVIEA